MDAVNNPTTSSEKNGGPEKGDGEKEALEKTIRFWKHPNLQGIPAAQKIEYLQERGITMSQIHQAWEKIATEDPNGSVESSSSNDPCRAQSSLTMQQQPGNTTTQPQAPATQHETPQRQSPMYASPMNNSGFQSGYSPYSPYYDSYGMMHGDDFDDGQLGQKAGILAVGGMLGLTAAAAINWLNGGDFKLLQSPTEINNTALHPDEGQEEYDDEEEEYEEEEEERVETTWMEDHERNQEIIEEISKLSLMLQENTNKQDKIFQKLSSRNDITDNSMNALRALSNKGASNNTSATSNKSDVPWTMIWAKLLEIKSELSLLQNQKTNTIADMKTGTNEKLLETLVTIDRTVAQIRDLAEIKMDSTPSADKSVEVQESTSETTDPIKNISEGKAEIDNKAASEENHTEPAVRLSLQDSLVKLVEKNELDVLRVGTQLLYLYMVNLATQPENPRYQKIYTNNDNYQKIATLQGAEDLLCAVGFERGDDSDCFEWLPNKDENDTQKSDETTEALGKATSALAVIKSCKDKESLLEDVLSRIQTA